jgi:hypothetical protein
MERHPASRSPRPPWPAPAAEEGGRIKSVTDELVQSPVLELASTNIASTYITCPADPTKTLGIKLPFLVGGGGPALVPPRSTTAADPRHGMQLAVLPCAATNGWVYAPVPASRSCWLRT